jgi:hypothetical protein
MNDDETVVLYGSVGDGYTDKVKAALDGASVCYDEFDLTTSMGMVLPTVVVSHHDGAREVYEGYGRIKRQLLPRLAHGGV